MHNMLFFVLMNLYIHVNSCILLETKHLSEKVFFPIFSISPHISIRYFSARQQDSFSALWIDVTPNILQGWSRRKYQFPPQEEGRDPWQIAGRQNIHQAT